VKITYLLHCVVSSGNFVSFALVSQQTHRFMKQDIFYKISSTIFLLAINLLCMRACDCTF